jgi:hypothetical protein
MMTTPFAMILQDGMQAAAGTLSPDTPLEHRHLILAYAAVLVIQLGYVGWVVLQRYRLRKQKARAT